MQCLRVGASYYFPADGTSMWLCAFKASSESKKREAEEKEEGDVGGGVSKKLKEGC